jgi:RNA polymerase sigma-70 factor (ECF subfamily)
MSPTDDELLQAWSEGEDSAAAALIERHFNDLYRFFEGKAGDDAEDLIQQTLVGCLEQRQRQGTIRSFRAFLFGVARNRLVDYFRSRDKLGSNDPLDSSLADQQTPLSKRLVRDEQERYVLEALRRIPLQSQILLELYYWQGLTGAELAQASDVPEGTLRGRLRRAKTLLSEQLQQLVDTPIPLEDTLTRLADWRAPSQ